MATRQTSRKSPRPVIASPTSKPPRNRTAATRQGASQAEATSTEAPDADAIGASASEGSEGPSPRISTASKQPVRPTAAAAQASKQAGRGSAATASQGAAARFTTPVRGAFAVAGRALGAIARWSGGGLPLAALLFSLLGLADSIYLTIQHFTEATSFVGCSEHGTVNCLAVTTSIWSRVPAGMSGGIPVSVLGLAFFAFMVATNSRWGWRARWPIVHWARLASVSVGIVFVLYLLWAELFKINAICLYCTGVHIITFIVFALIVSRVVTSGIRGTGALDHG